MLAISVVIILLLLSFPVNASLKTSKNGVHGTGVCEEFVSVIAEHGRVLRLPAPSPHNCCLLFLTQSYFGTLNACIVARRSSTCAPLRLFERFQN